MAFNVADLFEHSVDAVGDRVALICDDESRTFDELEERTNRIAHALAEGGIGPGDHVGVYGPNSLGWVEVMMAAFKLRAVPININFRYVTDELRYLFDNADLKALAFDLPFASRVAEVRDELPLLEQLVVFDHHGEHDEQRAVARQLGARTLDEVVAAGRPERDFPERSGDDLVIIYTGGTTGMPKGVMWRAEDIFYSLAGGINPFTLERVTDEYAQSAAAAASPGQLVFMTTPPLMHGAAFVSTMMQLFQGNQNLLVSQFDPVGVWQLIDRHRVNSVLITGDAMGRPMIEALETLEADGAALDLSCLVSVSSSAAVFSRAVKERFLDRFEHLVLTDSIGSTEGGFNGIVTVGRDNSAMKGGGPTVQPGRDVAVLDDDLKPVEPGSGQVGRLARHGNVPLGYYKDETKTAQTFVVAADGRRYAIPGDFASIEADGTITLLGRGSTTINTGGEKVHPEEVEQVLKAHPAVFDALVVGVSDPRWGQKVAAVVQPRDGHRPTLEELDRHCREHVAGYKVPRQLHLVGQIERSPAGKPDYPWAKKVAEASEHLEA